MSDQVKGKTGITEFLELSAEFPVVDVRSPAEYARGHIPGAVNIPLFSNEEREKVGIEYKESGRTKAVLRGLELTGPQIAAKLSEALALAKERKLLLYCWRGGMRSEAMAWLFSTGGIAPEVLSGGYKSYRNHILGSFSERRKLIILGGFTGSGKTEILHYLAGTGETVIDLEGLAKHRGSAFGSLDGEKQPSSEHFANLLHAEWQKSAGREPLWIEDESRNIGSVFMPDNFYSNIQQNPVIALMMPPEARVPTLVREYSALPPENLKASVMKISKRLGGDRTREIISSIDSGDFGSAVTGVLGYYDKAYLYDLQNKPAGMVHFVYTDTADVKTNAGKILEAKDKMKFI